MQVTPMSTDYNDEVHADEIRHTDNDHDDDDDDGDGDHSKGVREWGDASYNIEALKPKISKSLISKIMGISHETLTLT